MAGLRAAVDVAFDTVPARLKPFAGISTCSSPGREMTTRRLETDATSSRTYSSSCEGTLIRSKRPDSSPQMSIGTSVVPVDQRRVRAARQNQSRHGLNTIGLRLADAKRRVAPSPP